MPNKEIYVIMTSTNTQDICTFCKTPVASWGLLNNGNMFCTAHCSSAFDIYQTEEEMPPPYPGMAAPHAVVKKVRFHTEEVKKAPAPHGGMDKSVVPHGGMGKCADTIVCTYCRYTKTRDKDTLTFEGRVYCREKCRALGNQRWVQPPQIHFGGVFATGGAPVLMSSMLTVFPYKQYN